MLKIGDRVRLKADWSHRGIVVMLGVHDSKVGNAQKYYIVEWGNGKRIAYEYNELEIIG